MSRRVLTISVIAVLGAFAAFGIWSPGGVSEVEAVPVVGEGSCQGDVSCVGLGPNAVIGDNSCNGEVSCTGVNGVVGDNSCNGEVACTGVTGEIGSGSCNGEVACTGVGGDVGDGSCNGYVACTGVGGVVGNNSCNGYVACTGLSGTVGDDSCWDPVSCTGVSSNVGDCFANAGCEIVFSKIASPSEVPANGGEVAYRLILEILGDDIQVNFIEDDQYDLDEGECRATGAGGQLDLPAVFDDGDEIICDYVAMVPPGPTGATFDNVAVANIIRCDDFLTITSMPDLSVARQTLADNNVSANVPIFGDLAVAQEACELPNTNPSAAAIEIGEHVATIDVTAEASVLYVAEEQRRPNIGGALSGLFTGQPTPLPTAPAAVAPAATAPTISPPRTGDAGLADGGNRTAVTLGLLLVVSAGLAFGLKVRTTR